MTEILLIVARNEMSLYSYVRHRFGGEGVEVVVDRRQGERRRARAVPAVERRETDRRAHQIDDRLNTQGWAVINVTRAHDR